MNAPQTPPPFEVYTRFSFDELCHAMSSSRCGASQIKMNPRVGYLDGYLRDIGAKTLLVEHEYVDGDYLDDFASYYVKCFSHYECRCKRLHFFRDEFTERELRDLIRKTVLQSVRDRIVNSYLGFVVARPLPQAVLGRTVLETYPTKKAGGTRHYPCAFRCTPNLFGETLSVEGLPYQEQDNVLAKCATVALWSSFQKAARLFGTTAPRPTAITSSANRSVVRARAFPSKGLVVEQMCGAILATGLEPEVIPCSKDLPLVSLLYGYLKYGVPAILGVTVGDRGKHAITLAGFSLLDSVRDEREVAVAENSIPLIGRRIDEFYAHDDQIGPFARLKVKRGDDKHPIVFEGSWTDRRGNVVTLVPEVVIAPVYNKIRLSFTDVFAWAWRFHKAFSTLFQPMQVEWDIHLTTTNEYKTKLVTEATSPDELEQLRLRQHPRFIWRLRFVVNGAEAAELLADATDINRSFPVYGLIWKNARLMDCTVRRALADADVHSLLAATLTEPFLEFLREGARQPLYLRPKTKHRDVY